MNELSDSAFALQKDMLPPAVDRAKTLLRRMDILRERIRQAYSDLLWKIPASNIPLAAATVALPFPMNAIPASVALGIDTFLALVDHAEISREREIVEILVSECVALIRGMDRFEKFRLVDCLSSTERWLFDQIEAQNVRLAF